MAITRTIEWTLESGWLAVFKASTDLVAIVGADIRREFDISEDYGVPAILINCPGATPVHDREQGEFLAPVVITAVTSMDDDPTGAQLNQLIGAVRDVFVAAGLLNTLASVGGITVSDVQQKETPLFEDDGDNSERYFQIEFLCRCSMEPAT